MKKASTVTKNHQPEIPPEADTAIVVDATSSAVMPHPRSGERSVEEVVAQVEKVQRLMKSALIKDEHYGVIPGTNNKPTLLQPGAQKLCFLFRLVPRFHVERVDLPGNHREYTVRCELENSQLGVHVGEGVGLCSTMESKYRWRKAGRVCPNCGSDCINRSKIVKNGEKGWYCFAKIGGCGEEFGPKDSRIVGQEVGRKENPDIADTYNTVLKMAKKRAFVDATLTTTAASDIFTQDVEDMDVGAGHPEPAARPNTRNGRAAGRTAQTTGLSTITGDQVKQLWGEYALARSEKTGSTVNQIMRDVLRSLGFEETKEIPSKDFEHVRGVIEQWQPVMDLPTEPEKDSGKAEPGADG